MQEKTGDLTVILQESLAGIRIVKAFAREHQQTESFGAAAEALAQARIAVAAKEALSFPLLTLLLSLSGGLDAVHWGRQVIAGAMSLGTLVAATSYLAQLAQPLRRLSWLTGMTSLCQAGAARIFEILDAVPDIQDTPQARPLPHLEGWVQFEHVNFRYSAGSRCCTTLPSARRQAKSLPSWAVPGVGRALSPN